MAIWARKVIWSLQKAGRTLLRFPFPDLVLINDLLSSTGSLSFSTSVFNLVLLRFLSGKPTFLYFFLNLLFQGSKGTYFRLKTPISFCVGADHTIFICGCDIARATILHFATPEGSRQTKGIKISQPHDVASLMDDHAWNHDTLWPYHLNLFSPKTYEINPRNLGRCTILSHTFIGLFKLCHRDARRRSDRTKSSAGSWVNWVSSVNSVNSPKSMNKKSHDIPSGNCQT